MARTEEMYCNPGEGIVIISFRWVLLSLLGLFVLVLLVQMLIGLVGAVAGDEPTPPAVLPPAVLPVAEIPRALPVADTAPPRPRAVDEDRERFRA